MRAYGRDQVKEFISREIQRTKDPEQQRLMRELLGRY
jgi:hypothetical protein